MDLDGFLMDLGGFLMDCSRFFNFRASIPDGMVPSGLNFEHPKLWGELESHGGTRMLLRMEFYRFL